MKTRKITTNKKFNRWLYRFLNKKSLRSISDINRLYLITGIKKQSYKENKIRKQALIQNL